MGLDEIDEKLKSAKKKKSISITIDPQVNDEFGKIAKNMGVPKSKIIEQLMIVYIEQKKSLFRGE